MAKYSINDTTLKAIADPLRSLLGLTGGMTPEEMASNGAAVQANVTAALTAIAEKGVTVPDGADSDDLAELIRQFKDLRYETWVFELESGSTVEKVVYVG
jgi:hypothetical protein